jgi:SAM-dependent methyltransferase
MDVLRASATLPSSMASGPTCRICGEAISAPPFRATESMLGRGDAFEYRECSACGCVQIAEYPRDIAAYYPQSYYSMHVATNGHGALRGVERWLRKHRARHALGRLDVLGLGLHKLFGALECYDWLRFAGVGQESSVLDVGCGNGFLLSVLQKDGFSRLEGVDPFARDDARTQAGFVIRRSLDEIAHRPDFILLSHSLEHMQEQRRVLERVRAISSPTTCVCVRIPLAAEAFRRYRENWVQLDPPRHYYLHTPKSFTELARQAGFRVVATKYDSTGFQFWGSEQKKLGIPLFDPRSQAVAAGARDALFDRARMRDWEREAAELNRDEQGDQATFFLRVSG